jgi:short-subunit dehydrogenase involved in D-alanine esterification of teichoic acids
MRASPDVDCVFFNAGVQGHYDFSQPAKVDLEKFISEINVNFTSSVAITHAILPYLIGEKSKTGLI